MREIPKPEREEWIARLRERARLDAAELVPRPPFRGLRPVNTGAGPGALAEAGQVNGAWTEIGLAYGDWAAPAGPWVCVTTAAPEPERS